MQRKNLNILFFTSLFIVCISNINSTFASREYINPNQGIIVNFPKYSVKFAALSNGGHKLLKPNIISHFQDEFLTDAETWNNYEQSIFKPEIKYPIITREPIETKNQCIYPYFAENEPSTYKTISPRNSNNLFWSNDLRGDKLRIIDPRTFIASHTHFIKIKKPTSGKKVIFTHNKQMMGHDHDHFHHFGGSTNIHKNTHIHVHNRDAESDEIEPVEFEDSRRFTGSHLFAAPRFRRSVLSRTKRGVIDLMKIFKDHKTKIDFPKTVENVGAATRNIFEEDYSPVYHIRNALGSAQDSVYSLLNVRPHGILIPCRYRIKPVNDEPKIITSPIVGGINPAIYRLRGREAPSPLSEEDIDDQQLSEEIMDNEMSSDYENQNFDYNDDPLQQLGSKFRESVQWAQKSVEHAIDALHGFRKSFHAAKGNWPKLLLPYAAAVETLNPKSGEQYDVVGAARDSEFVGVGKMLDYLGITDRKPDLTRVGSPRLITEEEMILRKAKDALGTPTYNHFISEIKKHLDYAAGKNDLLGLSRLSATNIKAKLALERIRSSLRLQKAKADLKRLKIPKIPVIPKKLRLPIYPKSPLIKSVYNPNLQLVKPLKKSIVPVKPPVLKLPDPKLKTAKTNEQAKNDSDEYLDKIRAALAKARKAREESQKNLSQTTTSSPKILNPLDKIQEKLNKKYDINNDGTDYTDILGKTLAKIKDKSDGEKKFDERTVGAPQSVSSPLFTNEMKSPFLGLATQADLERYFKKLYCSNCKMGGIK